MATATQQVTVEEFDRLAEQPENAARRLEYIGGDVVEVVSNNYASVIANKISFYIQLFLIQHNIEGYVTGADGGYQIGRQRYIPDAAYISKARQPHPSHDAYNPNPPELAVEVLSPTDSPAQLRFKIASYLAVGTLVWVINPEEKHVEIYTPGEHPVRVDEEGRLDGANVLPGFTLAVKDIFPD
ncbi:MAG: Uma2 family endonuclease [Chloroflexi bacterium]|nr:Uma2 family endonuclease [Chloroflexota bacterium]